MAFRFETANERWSWYKRSDGSYYRPGISPPSIEVQRAWGEAHRQDEKLKEEDPFGKQRFWQIAAHRWLERLIYAAQREQRKNPNDPSTWTSVGLLTDHEGLKARLKQFGLSDKEVNELADNAIKYYSAINRGERDKGLENFAREQRTREFRREYYGF